MWRLVLGKYATLQELETHWSFDDLIRCNLALNLQEAVIAKSLPKMSGKGR